MSLASEVRKETIGNYIQFSANAMYIFECILIFPQEVNAIWARKWSTTTWLYVSARYTSLLYAILVLCPVSDYESCAFGVYTLTALQLAQIPCFALFSALRAFALLEGEALVPFFILALNLVPLGVNIYERTQSAIFRIPGLCELITTVPAGIMLQLSLTSRLAVISADVLVVLVSWHKIWKMYRDSRRFRTNAPLVTLLLRDGTLYFLVLLVLNVLQLITINVPSLVFLNVGTPYYTTLTPIIICRFILNLRYTKPSGSSYPSNSNSASYRFTGNMGESLSIVGDEEDGDDYGGGFNYSNDSDNSDAVEMSVIERGLGDGVDAAPGENSDPHRV